MGKNPQIGSGERTSEESPPAGRVIDETDYFRVAANTVVIDQHHLTGFVLTSSTYEEIVKLGLPA